MGSARPRSPLLTAATAVLVPGRTCDGCTLCCELFEVPSLAKPAGVLCSNCTGSGCAIHAIRSAPCRDFFCHYRIDANVPEHWRPDRSHMVLRADDNDVRILAFVDTKHPDAWRAPLYYADLKAWSANRLKAGKQIHVRSGERTIVILPDRDVDLGVVGTRVIVAEQRWSMQHGARLEFELRDRDDPWLLPRAPI
jgi:hypothetical protein